MTKRCPSCKTEVPADARVCPNCPETFADESGDLPPTVGTSWSPLPFFFLIVVLALVAAVWFVMARQI